MFQHRSIHREHKEKHDSLHRFRKYLMCFATARAHCLAHQRSPPPRRTSTSRMNRTPFSPVPSRRSFPSSTKLTRWFLDQQRRERSRLHFISYHDSQISRALCQGPLLTLDRYVTGLKSVFRRKCKNDVSEIQPNQ